MRILKWGSMILLVGFIIALIAAPIGPMPGIFISGTASDVPDSWGDTSSIVEIDLQVGEGPLGRTVTVWTVQVDGDLYVTGQKDSGWVSGIAPGGPVRLQMDGKLYDLTAETETKDAVNVLSAWQEKYTIHYPDMMGQFPEPEKALSTAVVYKLKKRV